MNETLSHFLYLLAAALFILGLHNLGVVKTARRGNALSALGMLLAIVVTLLRGGQMGYGLIIAGIVVGGAIGGVWAAKVPMTGMPQMVAIFNGFGGGASAVVALSEYFHGGAASTGTLIAILVSVLIGGVTFSGSFIAFAKLQELIRGRPVLLPGRHAVNAGLFLLTLAMGAWLVIDPSATPAILILLLASLALGVLLVIPIGGADMPVVISLLNSYSGMAVAATGFVLRHDFLIVSGNLVGASGVILTMIMCKAMNRSLANVVFGGFGAQVTASGPAIQGDVRQTSAEELALLLQDSRSVIFCPGYGMAVSQAQHAVREVSDLLEKSGTQVRFAIHPVAGRMPGHMNVLLAEANISYDKLFDLDQINNEFVDTDVAIVVGANDVVNPAAKNTPGSPIYGMPVLNADQARTVVVLKRSMNPGFAGIDNELFVRPNTVMLFGDAKGSLAKLASNLKEAAG